MVLAGLNRNQAPGISGSTRPSEAGGLLPNSRVDGTGHKGFLLFRSWGSVSLACLSHPAIRRSLAPSVLCLDPLSVSPFQAPDPRTWSSRTKVLPRAASAPLWVFSPTSCSSDFLSWVFSLAVIPHPTTRRHSIPLTHSRLMQGGLSFHLNLTGYLTHTVPIFFFPLSPLFKLTHTPMGSLITSS